MDFQKTPYISSGSMIQLIDDVDKIEIANLSLLSKDKIIMQSELSEAVQISSQSPTLFIQPILSNILSHLDIPDLLNCRSVCSEWDNQIVALLILHSRLEVNFQKGTAPLPNGSSEPIGNMRMNRNLLIHRLRKLTTLTKSSRRIPFTKYKFGDRSPLDIFQADINNLFQSVGSTVKYLELEIPKYLDVIKFLQKLRELTPNLVTLHMISPNPMRPSDSLKMECMPSDDNMIALARFSSIQEILYTQKHDIDSLSSLQWKRLFEALINVRTVKMSFKAKDFPEFHNSSFRDSPIDEPMLVGLIESGRIATITGLWLYGLNNATLTLLLSVKYPQCLKEGLILKELYVKQIMNSEMEEFNEFLHTLKKTLVKLQIRKVIGQPQDYRPTRFNQRCYYITPREMIFLKFISLKITVDGILLKCNSSKDLPNLVKVVIPEIICDMAEEMSKEFISQTVKNLEVRFNNGEWEGARRDHFKSPNTVTSLGKMFPAVESLTMSYPSRRQISKLPISWPNLKHLKLNIRKRDYAKRIKDLSNFQELCEHFSAILDLKQLQTFSVSEYIQDTSGCNLLRHRLFTSFTY